MIDITREVAAAVAESLVAEGAVTVFVPHTTAAVTINENADPDVIHDVLAALDKAVPWQLGFYRHSEGNSAAHLKSSLIGCSIQCWYRRANSCWARGRGSTSANSTARGSATRSFPLTGNRGECTAQAPGRGCGRPAHI
jgi:hypothetical protein